MAGKKLIVTCDDFGADIAVNEAVEQAFTDGILTCASLMVGGDAVDDAVARARRLKGLGVGLHIALTDARPVLPPAEVSALVGRDGRFLDDLVQSGIRWFFNPRARAQLHREIRAQFQAFAATGLVLDHVNVHQHQHLHPTVAAMITRIGRRYGMLAIRIPDEPRDVLMAAEPGLDIPKSHLGPVLWWLRRCARRARLIQNDAVFGLAWSGDMTEGRLLALIPHLPDGLNELYSHPATKNAAQMPHAARGYKYREELQALLSPKVKRALAANGIELTRFTGGPAKT
ncbi:MAG TPA: hopanoid biosynthesis-associated protein HpnK [Alphaproteobacteria bacterium]|nr:hopanoid biosynthesis-associated protein HpnK [Alphaproteobacteria bacterium]